MNLVLTQPATLEDLYRYPGKAELIGGRIVPQMATGHGRIASHFVSLAAWMTMPTRPEKELPTRIIWGSPCSKSPSGRESFLPDAWSYIGPLPADPMRLLKGRRPLPWKYETKTIMARGRD